MVLKRPRTLASVDSARRRSLSRLDSSQEHHFVMPLETRNASFSDEGSVEADDDIRSCCSADVIPAKGPHTIVTGGEQGITWSLYNTELSAPTWDDNCSISSDSSCSSLDLTAATAPIHCAVGVPQTIPEQSSVSNLLQYTDRVEALHNEITSIPLAAPPSPQTLSAHIVSQTPQSFPIPQAPASWSSDWTQQSFETTRSTESTDSTNTKLIFTASKRKNPIYFFIVAFLFASVYLYMQSNATLQNAFVKVKKLAFERDEALLQLRKADSDVRKLQAKLGELRVKDSRRRLQNGLLPNPKGDATVPGGLVDDDPSDSLFNDLVESGPSYKPKKTPSHSGNRRRANNNPPTHNARRATAHLHKGKKQGSQQALQYMNVLRRQLQEGTKRIGSLQEYVQKISYRDAVQKYGSGKLLVEIELDFPEDSKSNLDPEKDKDKKPKPTKLVIEMASLKIMPHSVFIFLEMVHYQLFDGCSFILNALHVIKAAPLPYDGSSASAKVRSFVRKGLESVAFREYSPRYPHLAYTVGFAADGSPSFYINTQNNTDVHDGDPCFGTIIEGMDVVKRLEASPTRNGIWYKQRIGIKRAQIIT